MKQSRLTRIARLTSLMTIGLVLGFVAWQAFQQGYFSRWRRLAIAPQDAAVYLAGRGQAADLSGRITKPCDFSKPEFSFPVNAPARISDCIQLEWWGPEVYDRRTYVLDQPGSVWAWSFRLYAPEVELAMFCMSGFGLGVGALVGILIEAMRMVRGRAAAPTADRPGSWPTCV